jgi:hypothetical protein
MTARPTKTGKTFPHKWIHPDPFDHERYMPFLKARAQSNFRGHEWTLTFEEFCSVWTREAWARRGREPNSLGMSRIDYSRGWTLDNVTLRTRREMVTLSNEILQTGKKKGRPKGLKYKTSDSIIKVS